MAAEIKYCPWCGEPLTLREIEGRPRLTCSCGYVFWDNPVPVVGAIVELGGRILLTRKATWPAGRWGLVAGFVEAAETTEQAAVREVREETGLAAEVLELVGIYTLLDRKQVYIVYRLRAAGAWQVGEELEALREFSRQEVAELVKGYPPQSGAGRALRDWLGRHPALHHGNGKEERCADDSR
jgi:NAD+ diphosphatase